MFRKLLAFLVLPAQMSAFEAGYLERMNRVALGFFALHVPALALVAAWNQTGPVWATALSALVMVGPLLAFVGAPNPRVVSLVFGVAAMMMGGLLVHFGAGPTQIEMHFYFFALLAMLATFGNPLVIVSAAATVALHHLALWLLVPASVFNYDASILVVALHAAFVLLESVAACFIARTFFDNVIGMEKIVQARTAQLDARNRDLRLVLDNVQQGFLTVDRGLIMSSERSQVVEQWLGPVAGESGFVEYLSRSAPRVAQDLRVGWEQVLDDVLPLELALSQLPRAFAHGGKHFRLDYRPIFAGQGLEQLLIVISDVSAELENERMELEQRDVLRIMGRVAADKNGVLEFFQESREQIACIVEARGDLPLQRRVIHTLKGNTMIFGVHAIASMCEHFENRIDETGELPSQGERAELGARWDKLCTSLELLLGGSKRDGVEIDDLEYDAILAAVLRGAPRDHVAARIRSWRLEPTRLRLKRIGEQAQALALRTGKGALQIELRDDDLRLDSRSWASFWSAFVHVVRNAVDHGIEPEDERRGLGKGRATITLCTRLERGDLLIELSDDGRGVNWARVAEKARLRGIPHESRSDLVEALFSDGLSTLDEATAYSGRGVGMAAVRASAHERGGSVTVCDREGGGTVVQFRFLSAQQRELAFVPALAG